MAGITQIEGLGHLGDQGATRGVGDEAGGGVGAVSFAVGGAAVEQLVRSRAGAAWPASADFAQTAAHLRTAIQIPSAAHSALEYQRWAARSQVRGEGRRFMRAMKQRTAVPVLHLHGTADPYVLDDPVRRTQRYAPQTRFVSVPGAGHFAHEEQPSTVTSELSTFLHQLPG